MDKFNRACLELETYVLDTAPLSIATSYAPSTYEDLLYYEDKEVIPVFDGGCDKTIYTSKEANYAFRAWHDRTHIMLKADFSLEGEEATAQVQVKQAAIAGLSEDALAVLWCDIVGQAKYYYKHKKYVDNQKEFVLNCYTLGILRAIEEIT